jgi:hypothetical protein
MKSHSWTKYSPKAQIGEEMPQRYFGPKCQVTKPGKPPFEVKNLGWLLRHASQVKTITLVERDDGARCGCILHALLSGGVKYRCAFNSTDICLRWVTRRSLKGARLINRLKRRKK